MIPDNDLNMETELDLQLRKYMIPMDKCPKYKKSLGISKGLCELFEPYRKVYCSTQAFCTWKREYLEHNKNAPTR